MLKEPNDKEGNKESDVSIEKEQKPGGIGIEQTKGEIEPPLAEREEGAAEEEEIEAKKITGKIPLSPAVIKPPLRLEGRVLSEVTGWTGWLYDEEELNELCSLIEQCGIEMTPQIQVFIALGTMHGARFVGFMDWKRRGRPGDTRKKAQTGVEKKEEKEGEEVIP